VTKNAEFLNGEEGLSQGDLYAVKSKALLLPRLHVFSSSCVCEDDVESWILVIISITIGYQPISERNTLRKVIFFWCTEFLKLKFGILHP
jgi:hypothetical protein